MHNVASDDGTVSMAPKPENLEHVGESEYLVASSSRARSLIWRKMWRTVLRVHVVPVGDARDHFSELISEVERTQERWLRSRSLGMASQRGG